MRKGKGREQDNEGENNQTPLYSYMYEFVKQSKSNKN